MDRKNSIKILLDMDVVLSRLMIISGSINLRIFDTTVALYKNAVEMADRIRRYNDGDE